MQDPASQASVSSCGAHPAPGPGGSGLLPAQGLEVPARPTPFLLPFGLSLSHLSPCLLLPTARASWRAGAGLGPGSSGPEGVQGTGERMPAVSPAQGCAAGAGDRVGVTAPHGVPMKGGLLS